MSVTKDKELHESADALMEAAMRYWRVYQRAAGGAAVVWVKDTDGRMVILTRGEYRQTLMRNIDSLHDGSDVLEFDRYIPSSHREGCDSHGMEQLAAGGPVEMSIERMHDLWEMKLDQGMPVNAEVLSRVRVEEKIRIDPDKEAAVQRLNEKTGMVPTNT